MTEIVELLARFKGDASGLKSATETAERSLLGLKSAVTAVASSAFVLMVKHQMEVIDANRDMANSFGMTYKAFVDMALVSKEAGVEVGQLGSTLMIMQRNAVSAARGNEDNVRVFKALKIDAKELITLSVDKQFERVAAAVAKIENPTLRAAVAAEVFGRGARGLINIFGEYNAKLQDAEKFNKKFAISLKDAQANEVDAALDAMGRVKAAIGGVIGKIGAELSPIITDMANWFIDSADGADIWADRVKDATTAVAWMLDKISVLIKATGTAWESATTVIGGAGASIYAKLSGEDDLVPYIGDEMVSKLQKEQDELWETDFNKISKFLEKSRADARKRADDFNKKQKKPSGGDAVGLLGDDSGAAKKAEDAVKKYNRMLEAAHKATLDYNNATADSFIRIKDGFMAGGKAADVFKKTALDAINQIGNNIIRMAMGGSSGGGGIMGALAGGVMNGITGGLFGGGAGGLFGGGSSGGIDWLPAGQSFAVGTDRVPRDMVANIHKDEMIIPAAQAEKIRNGGGASSPTIIQNITIGTSVSSAVRSEVNNMLPDIKRATTAAVMDAQLRGSM